MAKAKGLPPSKSGPTDQRNWKKVSSSFIDEIKHEKGRVKVNIGGRVYEYADRSGKKYEALSKGQSKGSAFNKKVKTNKRSKFRKTSRRK